MTSRWCIRQPLSLWFSYIFASKSRAVGRDFFRSHRICYIEVPRDVMIDKDSASHVPLQVNFRVSPKIGKLLKWLATKCISTTSPSNVPHMLLKKALPCTPSPPEGQNLEDGCLRPPNTAGGAAFGRPVSSKCSTFRGVGLKVGGFSRIM